MILLDALYLLVFIIVSPWLLVMMLLRPGFRAGVLDRFRPTLTAAPSSKTVWLHGSSAGEIDLLRGLVGQIESLPAGYRIVVSAFSISGNTAAKKAFPEHSVIYFPVDFSVVIRRFLKVIDPQLIVMVESELWPNFLATAHRSDIPVCLINARMSEKSFRTHSRWPLIPWALRKLSLLATQTQEDAARFRELGFPEEKLHVTGNMKYDLCDVGDADETSRLRQQLREQYGVGSSTPVLIGGSVHLGEDRAVALAYKTLVDAGRDLTLVLVPRYPADADAVVKELELLGLNGVRKSKGLEFHGKLFDDPGNVLIVDTMGDLRAFYTMSDIAYVGGSLHFRSSNKGGHNLMEPAVLNLAILFGPHNYSFRETVRDLRAAEAGLLVNDEDELLQNLRSLLDDPDLRRSMGQRARQVVLDNRGATRQNLSLLRDYLSPDGAHPDTQANEGIHIQS